MPRISTDNYDTVASWNGSQDLFVVEQPDGTKVATPAMVKQFIEAGDFEAAGEVKDGHGNILKDMAKSADVDAEIGDLSQTGLTGDSVAEQLGDVNNKVTIVNNISPGPNINMLRGVYVKIGNLVSVCLVCRATGAITADSVVCNVPANWQANAPLELFVSSQLIYNSQCRIFNGSVRAGYGISSGTEFTIQGMYYSTN